MTVKQMQGELAERELEALARVRDSDWLIWGEDTPGHDERLLETEVQYTEALKLLETAYATCEWEDLATDLTAMKADARIVRCRARLTLHHLPAVKDYQCGLNGAVRLQLRKELLAGSITEIEHFLSHVCPGWDSGKGDSVYEQLLSVRIQALTDLLARFDIEDLAGLRDMLRTVLPPEPYKWFTARTRLMDTILPMIRKTIGIEAEVAEDPNVPLRLNCVTILDDFSKWNDGLKTRPLPQQASKTLRFLYTSKAFCADSGKTYQDVAAFAVQECNSKAGPDWRIRKNAFNSGDLPELYKKVIGHKQVKYGQSDIYWLKLADNQ